WSPYAFADRPVSKEDLRSLFEAARWAPSSYNEQPWSYLIATKDEPAQFERVLSCLVEANQAWAKAAPVLGLGCTSLLFKLNGKPNPRRDSRSRLGGRELVRAGDGPGTLRAPNDRHPPRQGPGGIPRPRGGAALDRAGHRLSRRPGDRAGEVRPAGPGAPHPED